MLFFLSFLLCIVADVGDAAFVLPHPSSTVIPRHSSRSCTPLLMAKGLNSRNKQAELRKKMELAKQQNKPNQEGDPSAAAPNKPSQQQLALSAEEIKERNDRLRFEELLKTESFKALNDFASEDYRSKKQEEEEIDAAVSGVDRLFEGDPAPTDCFSELVNIQNENAIGTKGAERLVPWIGNISTKRDDYLVVLTDPRFQSTELRQSIKQLMLTLKPDLLNHFMVINADSPAENRRWIKKNKLNDIASFKEAFKSNIYSDEKLEWMRLYTALGDQRWSMTVFVLAEGKVQKLARDVDQYSVGRTIEKAVQSYIKDKNKRL